MILKEICLVACLKWLGAETVPLAIGLKLPLARRLAALPLQAASGADESGQNKFPNWRIIDYCRMAFPGPARKPHQKLFWPDPRDQAARIWRLRSGEDSNKNWLSPGISRGAETASLPCCAGRVPRDRNIRTWIRRFRQLREGNLQIYWHRGCEYTGRGNSAKIVSPGRLRLSEGVRWGAGRHAAPGSVERMLRIVAQGMP